MFGEAELFSAQVFDRMQGGGGGVGAVWLRWSRLTGLRCGLHRCVWF